MKKLYTTTIQTLAQWNCGNGQDIKEMLLRQAVKSCEHYATDVLVLIDSLNAIMEQDFDLEIGFRQLGLDWPISPEAEYRYHAKLVKVGQELTLFGEHGAV